MTSSRSTITDYHAYQKYTECLCIPDLQWWSRIILSLAESGLRDYIILMVALAILLLKTHLNEAENIIIIHLWVIFIFKKFPIGLKENL